MLNITDLIVSFERNLNIIKSQTKGLSNEESLCSSRSRATA